MWMIQHFHDLHFAKNFLQVVLIQLTFVDDFNGNLVRKEVYGKIKSSETNEDKTK